jgi:PAS domain S-box-containing protein
MVTSAPSSGGQICESFKRPGGRTHLGVLPITAGKSGSVGFLERLSGEGAAHLYAAIIESSADAILSKDLNGVIMSWNRGAERLFGYTAEEAVGKPVTILIPADRHNEESVILERVRRGENVEHYETVRQRKDGSLVDISLTVSPIKNAKGEVIAASKIARDITEIKRAQAQQGLLLREMDHRVKNLFAVATSVLSVSARSATSVSQLVESAGGRLSALARAHALTLSHGSGDVAQIARRASLHSLIETIMAPHQSEGESRRLLIVGSDIEIAGPVRSSLALLLHEFVTNSVKYGALSASEPLRVDRRLQLLRGWSYDKQDDQQVLFRGPRPRGANGFGSRRRACVALGGGLVYRRQDRLHGADSA